jgi:hypothetical protein
MEYKKVTEHFPKVDWGRPLFEDEAATDPFTAAGIKRNDEWVAIEEETGFLSKSADAINFVRGIIRKWVVFQCGEQITIAVYKNTVYVFKGFGYNEFSEMCTDLLKTLSSSEDYIPSESPESVTEEKERKFDIATRIIDVSNAVNHAIKLDVYKVREITRSFNIMKYDYMDFSRNFVVGMIDEKDKLSNVVRWMGEVIVLLRDDMELRSPIVNAITDFGNMNPNLISEILGRAAFSLLVVNMTDDVVRTNQESECWWQSKGSADEKVIGNELDNFDNWGLLPIAVVFAERGETLLKIRTDIPEYRESRNMLVLEYMASRDVIPRGDYEILKEMDFDTVNSAIDAFMDDKPYISYSVNMFETLRKEYGPIVDDIYKLTYAFFVIKEIKGGVKRPIIKILLDNGGRVDIDDLRRMAELGPTEDLIFTI